MFFSSLHPSTDPPRYHPEEEEAEGRWTVHQTPESGRLLLHGLRCERIDIVVVQWNYEMISVGAFNNDETIIKRGIVAKEDDEDEKSD